MIDIYIKSDENYTNIVRYVLKIIEINQSIQFNFSENKIGAKLIWDHTDIESQVISLNFYSSVQNQNVDFNFDHRISFFNEFGSKDYIASIFYKINCLQEFDEKAATDKYGRFTYTSSYQFKYQLIDKNLVQLEIDGFLSINHVNGNKKKSRFYISHDIDTLYGSFLQDGLWAVKNKKLGVIIRLIFNEVMQRPHWRNIDKILKISNEYDVYTTFFWLVNAGKGSFSIKNSDYSIKKEQSLINLVKQAGSFNGLHKSCSDETFEQELEKCGFQTVFNRYHFLRFNTVEDWRKLSDSSIKLDCSLGFAEHYGFRNSYGKAFQPFDIVSDKPYDFIEAPLHFMDTTFHQYLKSNVNTIGTTVIDFFEKNNLNCDISLLWHNTFFTDYKYNSYLKEYKKILCYIYENKIEVIRPLQLIEENKLIW